jgi:hypothetical protein
MQHLARANAAALSTSGGTTAALSSRACVCAAQASRLGCGAALVLEFGSKVGERHAAGHRALDARPMDEMMVLWFEPEPLV